MKRSLLHLPKHKRDELKEIVSIITELADVEMIILFGSYARGNWVEDIYKEGHITYEYKSDFDILVIVKEGRYARSINLWDKVRNTIHARKSIQTWVALIVHDVWEVNKALRRGQYFFTDIQKEGILLYDSKRFELAKAQKLSPGERQQAAQEDFRYWFKSARSFLIDFGHAFARRDYSKAAFELHQATERFYATTLLVFTHYKPKEHDIKILGKRESGPALPASLPSPHTGREAAV